MALMETTWLKQWRREGIENGGKTMLPNTDSSLPVSQNRKPGFEYSAEFFVDREKELDLVKEVLNNPYRGRMILVEGERGLGKTWLALHLHRTILQNHARVKSLLILMSPPKGFNPQAGEYCVSFSEDKTISEELQSLLKWMAESLEVNLPPAPVLEEISDRILQHIQQHEFSRYWLLLDSVYECRWEFVDAFETAFLMRFMALPNTFLWASGRGKPYPWKTPEAQRAILGSLAVFNEESLRHQLEKMGVAEKDIEKRLQWVKKMGKGIPLLTQILVEAKTKEEALANAVGALLEIIPQEKRENLKMDLERLSVLDGFREEEMEFILNCEREKISLSKVRQIRDDLLNFSLIRWKNGQYVLDQPLQGVLQEYLKACKPDEWKRLNECMIDYYQNLSEQPAFRNYRDFLEKKINHHRLLMGEKTESNAISAVNSPK